MALGKRSFSRFNEFQHNVARGKETQLEVPLGIAIPLHLRGRAGALVLAAARVSREFRWAVHAGDAPPEYSTKKFCAPRCTVSCVQQVGILDNWRDPQDLKPFANDAASKPARRTGADRDARGDS